jgi:hypothetical protein
LWIRPKLTLVKLLAGSLLWGRFLAYPTNVTLGLKGLPGINTKANYDLS